MSIDNQIEPPQSFMALFLAPGRDRPNAPQAVVLDRYERCEDMANLLTEHAQTLAFKQNLAESDVLIRCQAGLLAPEAGFSERESRWIVLRLAELLDWPAPEFDIA